MKTYEVIGHMTESVLYEIETRCADVSLMNEYLDDILAEMTAKMRLGYTNSDLSYAQVLIFKDAFKKGYLAAHAVKSKEEE